MVYMPQEKKGKSQKVARPYFVSYHVPNVIPSNVEVCLVDKPAEPSIFVSLDRVHVCYPELGDVSDMEEESEGYANKQGDTGTQVRRSGPVTCTHSQICKAHSN